MTNRPDDTRAWLTPDNAGVAAAIAVAAAIGAALVDRPGYGPDEEITWFAVEGIKAHGAPILPSGLAYFRGPAYSYLAWLSGLVSGGGFEAYRWLGVLSAAAVIIATALLARSLFDRGVVAAWLVALAPVTAASGAYARFYMPFAAVCTLTLIIAARLRGDRRMGVWFVVASIAARSLHEFGMLLALVPLAGWLSAESNDERRSFAWLFVVTTAALVAEHALLLWLPCIAWNCEGATWGFSSSGLPTITTATLPVAASAAPVEIVFTLAASAIAAAVSYRTVRADSVFTIAAAGAAALFANGVVAALVLLWWIARPSHASRIARAGLFAAAAGSVAWIGLIFVRGNALVDARFVWALLQRSFIFPWDGIQHLVTGQPVAMALIILGIWRGAFATSTPTKVSARTLAVVLYLELLSFGVTGMDVRPRFLVLIMPLVAVFAAAGIVWVAGAAGEAFARRSHFVARAAAVAIAILLVALVSVEQGSAVVPHRDAGPNAAWWAKWSPPVALSSVSIDRKFVTADDLIVTNDELAALLVLGRVDNWWPPDQTSAERYSFVDQRGGQQRGVYGGAPILADSSALRLLIEHRQSRGVVVALFNTGKFGFDPSNVEGLINNDDDHMVELERSSDWFVARFARRR